ncbi:Protein phosphatase PTC7-like protein [Armadillidium vulgare]|nr:Protein phosphatase PTC7-like protein [Armadillidium vulgare]
MLACKRLVSAGAFSPSEPSAIIAAAYNELLENKNPILGSSTACVVVLQGSFGKLFSANIGDSGFLVIRNGSVVHRSHEQQHYFNTPFQLSLPPAGVSSQVLNDRPESASTQSFDIKVGDMVLLATDGVFDNLPDSLILGELVNVAGTTDSSLLQKAANAIAKKAQIMAFDEQYMSPFAQSARKNGIDAVGKDCKKYI